MTDNRFVGSLSSDAANAAGSVIAPVAPDRAKSGSEQVPGATDGVQELTLAECWRLLQISSLGRLAVIAPDGHPDVFPLNYIVHGGAILLRSAAGTKLRSIATHSAVALEVDGTDVRSHWSVVVRARAHHMESDAAIAASGIRHLVSWSPTAKHNFICLTPDTVTGRRFAKGALGAFPKRDRPHVADEEAETDLHSSAPDEVAIPTGKPLPIPHYSPFSD